jgi:hypothetical protein
MNDDLVERVAACISGMPCPGDRSKAKARAVIAIMRPDPEYRAMKNNWHSIQPTNADYSDLAPMSSASSLERQRTMDAGNGTMKHPGKQKLEDLVAGVAKHPDWFEVYVRPDAIRSVAGAFKALEGALRDIAESDDIENALDPARNKRIARATLERARHEG